MCFDFSQQKFAYFGPKWAYDGILGPGFCLGGDILGFSQRLALRTFAAQLELDIVDQVCEQFRMGS